MTKSYALFQNLSEADIVEVKTHSLIKKYKKNELIFTEGDTADSFYIITSGKVSIYIDKCGKDEPVSILKKDDFFGEMAIFSKDKRTASAIAYEDTTLLCIGKDQFLAFVKTHPLLAHKINRILIKRNEELLLKENLINTTGLNGKKMHISIKGDPSLRESAFSRDRYESIVDKLLPLLEKNLEDILVNRCIYRIIVHFNSGEIRTSSVLDPFNEEIHTANKLINKPYIERHFSIIPYAEKADYIKRMFALISNDVLLKDSPAHLKNIFFKTHNNWQPINTLEISKLLSKLGALRSIPNFYLRNISINIVHDSIRLQFNCDATHFVSTKNYQSFIEENVMNN